VAAKFQRKYNIFFGNSKLSGVICLLKAFCSTIWLLGGPQPGTNVKKRGFSKKKKLKSFN
jgi:hypothetical protein